MRALRFVQEYCGRRIVTDGTLFGIEGELVTDCRYLGMNGAQRAIDSELRAETSKAERAEVQRVDVEWADYFENYNTRSFSCACGWRGDYKELTPLSSCCSSVVDCPACAVPLLAVYPPSADAIKAAATGGTAEALAMLPALHERERANAVWSAQALKDVSQLPELHGKGLAFTLDLEDAGDGGYLVVKLGERLVWREALRAGDRRRFYELKRLLKKKYNGRFMSLPPTKAAEKSLDEGSTWANLSMK